MLLNVKRMHRNQLDWPIGKSATTEKLICLSCLDLAFPPLQVPKCSYTWYRHHHLPPLTHAHAPSLSSFPHCSITWVCCELTLGFAALTSQLSPRTRHINTQRTACMGVEFESMKQQLLLLVEQAKHIPEFCSPLLKDWVWPEKNLFYQQITLFLHLWLWL